MLTFERRLLGDLISAHPGLMPRPSLVVARMTTSTGAAGADYVGGFSIGPLAHDTLGFRIYAVCSCDVLLADGTVSPDTIWAYGDTGMLRGFNVRSGKEVDQTTDVPPWSVLRIVVFGS